MDGRSFCVMALADERKQGQRISQVSSASLGTRNDKAGTPCGACLAGSVIPNAVRNLALRAKRLAHAFSRQGRMQRITATEPIFSGAGVPIRKVNSDVRCN